MVAFACLWFGVITLSSVIVAVWLGRKECARVADVLAAANDSSQSGVHVPAGTSTGELDLSEEVVTDGELVRRARAPATARARLLAFDELVGRYELSRARHRTVGRGVGRLALASGGAGATLVVALALPQPTAGQGLLSGGSLVFGGVAFALVAWQAQRHERALGKWRLVLGDLRRELDSKTTSG